MELDGTIPLGPLTVAELSIALVGLAFPVDLSGGVPRFRHRRGVLERLALEGRHDRLAAQLAPRLRGVLGPTAPSLLLAKTTGGILVGIHDGASALAFDALWAPRDGEARWVIASARGIGLGRPALAVALSALDGMIGRAGERQGTIVSLGAAAATVMEEVLPPAGARLPDARQARWGALEVDTSGWRVECDRTLPLPALDPRVVRELELAALTLDADDALAGGDYERAREGYLALLERAPRHPALALRIADIDRWVGERSEAALATITETMVPGQAGALGGDLLAATENRLAARDAYAQAADEESYGPLAALMHVAASRLADDPGSRLRSLDDAVARAPASPVPRWARLEARLDLGDFQGAMADLEHLEAAARGPFHRHDVWRRAGEAWLERGHDARAIAIFERALRYAPESPQAVSGLARSLLATGRTERALGLLSRAIELSDKANKPAWDIVLSLAHALAEDAGDFPAAIARVRTIPAGQPESLDARGLEARWRARLGDRAGASIAFARMREWIETAGDLDATKAARWLSEAACFERDSQVDPRAREQHLELALRLDPREPSLAEAFHEPVIEERPEESPAPPVVSLPRPSALPSIPSFALPIDLEPAEEDEACSPADEQRAQTLADRLRADPANHEIAVELADLLARMRRDLDLFALLSGRLEDATGDEREDLVPRQRAVLERLVASARRDGREDEASLYEFALERLA